VPLIPFPRCKPWAVRLLHGALALAALPAAALDLTFPGTPVLTAERREAQARQEVAVGPFTAQGPEFRAVTGGLVQQAFRLDNPGMGTLDLMAMLRTQVQAAGFSVIYECETMVCGGFDFRYATSVLPEPDMHVDLGDFRYLAAERADPKGTQYLSLLVSRAIGLGFVQVTEITPGVDPRPAGPPPDGFSAQGRSGLPDTSASAGAGAAAEGGHVTRTLSLPKPGNGPGAAAPSLTADQIGAVLTEEGRLVLENLVFASGSAGLEDRSYPLLEALAEWLRDHPEQSIALVGHTDASGGLAINIALSKRRAESVRQYLLDIYGLPAAQIAAEGVGYLAPRASNLTDAGRKKNRRVEVMLTSTP
jgi:outer membrane protein OmpA-like peptidoglycan-associated protein